MVRIGINGFGRIGRLFTRFVFERQLSDKIEIVVINDLGSLEAMAHLLEYDSIHGKSSFHISHTDQELIVDNCSISILHNKEPDQINWDKYGVDLVLESTGQFKTEALAAQHLQAGSPRVLITAVAAGEDLKTIVLGANHDLLDGSEKIISNASCTTNCAAPLVDLIQKNFQIDSGYITTVHSYTNDQSLHDRSHTDLRRARAAALSMIPTTTGAAKAITKVFPELEGKLGGAGIRVPIPNGSLTDITYIVKKQTNVDEVNRVFQEAANKEPWKGILEFTDKPLVSSDIIGNTHSAIFDSLLTSVIGNMVKVVAWYDNEAGYTSRLIDLILYWSKLWDSHSQRP